MSTGTIKAVKTRSSFRMQCTVSADIKALPDKVWAILTRAEDMARWNSTLTSIEGNIALGGIVSMQVPEAPGRTFVVKVTRFVPKKEMEWRQGNRLMFLGVRTYALERAPDGSATRFQMTEEFSGLLLPLIAGRLPDFGMCTRRSGSGW